MHPTHSRHRDLLASKVELLVSDIVSTYDSAAAEVVPTRSRIEQCDRGYISPSKTGTIPFQSSLISIVYRDLDGRWCICKLSSTVGNYELRRRSLKINLIPKLRDL
jgi:hypothetical protein